MKFSPLAAIPAVMLSLGTGIASGPIAIYALVDKVELEPATGTPERIRLSGVFTTYESAHYSAPQRGYLFFMLPANNRELALREWNDLRTIAGTHQVVGMGSSFNMTARVRRMNEPPASPDEYTMGNGLVRINADNPRARELLDYKGR